MISHPSHLACGGAALFPLPPGPACAGRARELLSTTMRALSLPDELVEDGALAVSELATNAHMHAVSDDVYAAAELWVWATTLPCPRLVVSVFDTDRDAMPRPGRPDLLEVSGRGLGIVQHLAVAWGAHATRSRLSPAPKAGKRVWFALTLPSPWPPHLRIVSASLASRRLAELLRLRGIEATRVCDDQGVSLITAGSLNIWVEPRAFAWCDGNAGYVRYPHLDVQEAVEHVVAALEVAADRSPQQPGEDLRTPPAPPIRRTRS